jgi:uncharacterized membrane protein
MSVDNKARSQQELTGYVLFGALLVWCLALIALRVSRTGTDHFLFLIWNLFLACIPLAASRLLRVFHHRRSLDVAQLILVGVWLLFLPNAPYILTDMVHLQSGSPTLYWYDLGVLLSCALTGLLLGYSSMFDVHRVIEERFGPKLGWVVAATSLVLSGYGVYLGRVLRWNSWDIVTNPRALFATIIDCVVNPALHLQAYLVSGFFGIAFLLGYAVLHSMTRARATLGFSR